MIVADMSSAWEALSEVFGFIVFAPMGWPFAFYALLQGLNLLILRGTIRWVSLVPLPFAVVVLALTTRAYADASNLWPIFLIFFGPLALAYETIVGTIGLVQLLRCQD